MTCGYAGGHRWQPLAVCGPAADFLRTERLGALLSRGMRPTALTGDEIGRPVRIELVGDDGPTSIAVGTLRDVRHRMVDGEPETRVVLDAFGGTVRLVIRDAATRWWHLDQ